MSEIMVSVSSVTDNDTDDAVMGLSTVGSLDGRNLDLTLASGYQQGDLVVGQSYKIELDAGQGTVTYDDCTHTSCDSSYAHFRLG